MTNRSGILFATESPCAGSVCATGRARADLATAMGLAEAGQRATAAIDGDQLRLVGDLLAEAAERLLPLVVRTRLAGGHAGLHALADAGALVLCAHDTGELAALHLAARLCAERALVPVVLADQDLGGEPLPLPAPAVALLGQPSEFVKPATADQELLFGKDRRRVVRWFDFERPVLRGQTADPALRSLQAAARGPFATAPAADLLTAALAEAGAATGRDLAAIARAEVDHAEVLVVALGGAGVPAALAGSKPRTGVLALRALRPFPLELAGLLLGKPVVVLEQAAAPLASDGPLLREVRACVHAGEDAARSHGKPWKDKDRPRLHSALHGLGGAPLPAADLQAYCREASQGGRVLVHLGVEFASLKDQLPKRLVLHEALRRSHPGLETLGLATAAAGAPKAPPAPLRAPQPSRVEATHDSLSRFWETLGAAATGNPAAAAPDPYLAAGSVPALSTTCRTGTLPAELPAFTPGKCTGCGRCWTACPDGAILPAALTAGELFEFGMLAGKQAGADTDALRQVAGRVQKGLGAALDATKAVTAGAALRAALATALDKLGPERGTPLRPAAEAVAASLDALPVARTAPLFDAPEGQEPGTGALLAFAIDAERCQGCNLCIAECAPGALAAAPCTPERAKSAAAAAALWRALPDTSGAVVAAAKAQPEPGLLGGLMLSRHCLHAFAPGAPSPAGDGTAIALRAALAAAEAHLQPLLQEHLKDLDALGEQVAGRIRDLLAAALPAADLDALHEGLQTLGQGQATLSSLATRLDQLTAAGRVDTTRLQRFVDTGRALADLRFRIATAHNGLGRARAGLVLQAGEASAAAAAFPWNPFAAPAVLTAGAAGHRALGLLRGAAAALAGDFGVLRAARTLLQKGTPGNPAPTFAELTDEERRLCPPLLLVADAEALGDGGLDQLAAVLQGDLPIKVLALTDLDLRRPTPDLALLALSFRSAFVLQGSIGHRDHLAQGLLGAFAHPGPALVQVHAPQPARLALAKDAALLRATAAVACHALPLFTWDPARQGAFGQRLALADAAVDGKAGATAADWAVAEPRYAALFTPTAPGDASPTPIAEWLRLEPRDRKKATPVVIVDGAPRKPAAALLAGVVRAHEARATLLELAGVVTPFTARAQDAAKVAVAAAHAQELAQLRAEHDRQLRAARAEVEAELAARLQRRLLHLAGGARP